MNIMNEDLESESPVQLNLFPENEIFSFEKLYSPEKYIITVSNMQAASYIFDLNLWKSDHICMIHGPEFSGKTHICFVAHKKVPNSIFINRDSKYLITKYEILDLKDFIILDDVCELSEEVLFHFFNYIRLKKKFLLISADDKFLSQIRLNDLFSRFSSVPNFHLNLIDEHLTRGIIIKILSENDIVLSPKQLKYISQNIERSFSAIKNFTSKLHLHILQNSGQINLNIIKNILY